MADFLTIATGLVSGATAAIELTMKAIAAWKEKDAAKALELLDAALDKLDEKSGDLRDEIKVLHAAVLADIEAGKL